MIPLQATQAHALEPASTPETRVGRLRGHGALREALRECHLRVEHLVAPVFVVERADHSGPIPSLPGVSRDNVAQAIERCERLYDLGIRTVLLFGIPSDKDAEGSAAWQPDGPVCQVSRALAVTCPTLIVVTDVCLCQYTDHGHCTSLRGAKFDRAASLDAYARIAVAHAEAGAKIVAPSCRLDGAVRGIRLALDANGHDDVGILSYAAKFASSLYGPFRDAALSSPIDGDRSGHQLDPANRREAVRQALADEAEGADALMVKPAGAYLDVLCELRKQTALPLAAYQVSGEYAALVAAADRGYLDLECARYETTLGLRRAGADLVITYFSESLARQLQEVPSE